MSRWTLSCVAVFCAMLAPALAAATPVEASVDARDIVALERLSQTAASAEERNLATGAALALRRKDDAALAVLVPLAGSQAPRDLRAEAYIAACEVYLRQGRFSETYNALKAAQTLSSEPLQNEVIQTMEFAQVLSGVTPMAVAHKAAGRLPVTRDMAGMANVSVKINGQVQNAVIDSGAAFSTISESTAKRLGVRMMEKATTVASASKDAVVTRVGIADRLEFGDAVLTNVVFAVLPDADLTFAGGKYKIDAIMGLPVFVALDRIEVASEAGQESLIYGPKPAAAKTQSNLLLAGVEPIVLVGAEKADTPLRMFIDTGAVHTSLNAKFLADYPALNQSTVNQTAHWEGAGGAATDEKARNVPELRLIVAGRPITLKDVRMKSKAEPDRHGAIGQDLLKQGRRWALDFANMSFTVSD